MPSPKAPPRNEIAALAGINERTIRYFEEIAAYLTDLTPLQGSGAPTGLKANASRLYVDVVGGALYVNTNPAYGATTGWVLA